MQVYLLLLKITIELVEVIKANIQLHFTMYTYVQLIKHIVIIVI